MELFCQRDTPLDSSMNKPTLTKDERLAQLKFAQSMPIIEREEKPSKRTHQPVKRR